MAKKRYSKEEILFICIYVCVWVSETLTVHPSRPHETNDLEGYQWRLLRTKTYYIASEMFLVTSNALLGNSTAPAYKTLSKLTTS